MRSIKYSSIFILFFCLQSCQLISNKKLPASNNNTVKLIIEGPAKLNKKVLWNFGKCGEITVNGIALKMFVPVSEWIKKLGEPRVPRRGTYVWDKLGLLVVDGLDKFRDTVMQAHIVFHYRTSQGIQHVEDIDTVTSMSDEDKQDNKEEILLRPQPYFTGGVLLDSVVMGRGMSIEDFNKLSKENDRAFLFYKDAQFAHMYIAINEKLPPNNRKFWYLVQLSEGYDDIEQVWIEYNYDN